ncbi:RNA helicase [Orbilia ellipsospora]|uniref:RNA helicase n=1 Tax=Orbilia ellipsospora TaxID=2528407 RepID=A0AAV9XSK3_9PEZI
MRRAASGLVGHSRPPICLLCRITQPATRPFSTTSPRPRQKTTARPLRTTVPTSAIPIKTGIQRFFIKKPPPQIKPETEVRPWSTALLKERLSAVFKRNADDPNMRIIWGDEATDLRKQDPEKFKQLFREYVDNIRIAVGFEGIPGSDTPRHIVETIKIVEQFKKMYAQGGMTALDVALMDNFIMRKYGANNLISAQRSLADFSHPAEWFPKTRTMKRTWHLHVGPTNSGKTYNALKRLEQVKDGIYCGPLRLLAHEVFTRLNDKGIRCNLVTGEERKSMGDDVGLIAATVEMASVQTPFEVAVIDEIQMLSDPERGWAWTHAVLGIMAKEVHLCGEDRSVEIVQKLAKLCGDQLIIHRYQRLGKLEVMKESLGGDLKRIEKGDCVVGFARKDIHNLKRYIEHVTGLKCAIVYGALPPETRALQAKYFNDPHSDYDVLVASDAVGLGLNLSIKRVVFSTMYKWDGQNNVVIPVPLTRQIAGRAGRYRSASDDKKALPASPLPSPPKVGDGLDWNDSAETLTPPEAVEPPKQTIPADGKTGYVTTIQSHDLEVLRENVNTEPPPIEVAIVLPRSDIVESYCALFPADTPFWEILSKMGSQADVSDLFKFCNIKPMIDVAKLLEPTEFELQKGDYALSQLSDIEKVNLSLAPVKLTIESCVTAFREFAKRIAKGERSTLLSMPKHVIDIEVLDLQAAQPALVMKRLEELHTVIMLYAWCSQRFKHTLTGDDITQRLKAETEIQIDRAMKEQNAQNEMDGSRQPVRKDTRGSQATDMTFRAKQSSNKRDTPYPRTSSRPAMHMRI